MSLEQDVRALLLEHECELRPGSERDVFELNGMTGDDVPAFMDHFAKQFGFDLSGYLWYFHHEEEGSNFGSLFFKPPNKRVQRIPISIDLLVEAAETKTWPVDYPPHSPPSQRYDLQINLGCFVILFAMLILALANSAYLFLQDWLR